MIHGDCNTNGQADVLDIALGISVDANTDGIPDVCASTIPTVSQWGLIAMGALLLLAGAGCVRRVRSNA